MRIVLENIEKKFNKDILFTSVNLIFELNNKYALIGANGSGKSTLLQIISSYLSPNKGSISYVIKNKKIEADQLFQYISIAAPYLELIEEMTLIEFLEYHFSFKKNKIGIHEMISLVNLDEAKNKPIEKFSSGMKQRVKLLQAFMSDTPILLLDEPCSNLDQDGINLYHQLMEKYTDNRIVIVASNEQQEIAQCNTHIRIASLKQKDGIKQ